VFVSCDKCGYDSEDRDSALELAEKVRQDGGHMELIPGAGWDIECPNGHSGDEVHID
jgi:hypothetical protein